MRCLFSPSEGSKSARASILVRCDFWWGWNCLLEPARGFEGFEGKFLRETGAANEGTLKSVRQPATRNVSCCPQFPHWGYKKKRITFSEEFTESSNSFLDSSSSTFYPFDAGILPRL